MFELLNELTCYTAIEFLTFVILLIIATALISSIIIELVRYFFKQILRKKK